MSHTPGPWYHWLPHGSGAGCREIRTEKGRTHGTYRGTEVAGTPGLRDDLEDEANARLIAAAPDLLAALEISAKVINAMYSGTLPQCFKPTTEVVNQINFAVAKAQGKTK